MKNIKLTALPFLIGSYGYGAFAGSYDFSISATVLLGILILTKQVKLY